MRIFFLTTTFQNIENGPSKFAQLLLELNDIDDIDFHLITEDVKIEHTSSNIHKVYLSEATKRSRVGMLARITDYTSAVLELNKTLRPDVIVCNNAILGHQLYNYNIPCIGMINDDNSINESIFRPRVNYQYVRLLIFKYYEMSAVKRAAGIISNSDIMTQKIIKACKAKPTKVFRLYKSVDVDVVNDNEAHEDDDELSILFVKSDYIRGGLLDLIKAANIIDLDLKINIVGPRLDDFERIRRHNTNPKTKLIFHGRVKQNEVFALMRRSSIFCTPSTNEALGVANMEALLQKTSVVYSDVGGIPEVMDYGENGFVANPGNPESLAEAILKSINNTVERQRKIDNGYRFVKRNFDKQLMLQNFLKICKSVL